MNTDTPVSKLLREFLAHCCVDLALGRKTLYERNVGEDFIELRLSGVKDGAVQILDFIDALIRIFDVECYKTADLQSDVVLRKDLQIVHDKQILSHINIWSRTCLHVYLPL